MALPLKKMQHWVALGKTVTWVRVYLSRIYGPRILLFRERPFSAAGERQ